MAHGPYTVYKKRSGKDKRYKGKSWYVDLLGALEKFTSNAMEIVVHTCPVMDSMCVKVAKFKEDFASWYSPADAAGRLLAFHCVFRAGKAGCQD